jgi:hypothetical protein
MDVIYVYVRFRARRGDSGGIGVDPRNTRRNSASETRTEKNWWNTLEMVKHFDGSERAPMPATLDLVRGSFVEFLAMLLFVYCKPQAAVAAYM